MTESSEFLKYVIHEDLYLIDTNQKNVVEQKPVESKEVVEPATVVATETTTGLPHRANEILVLFDNPSASEMLEAEKEYLGKIAGAIGKSLEKMDFQNLNSASPDTDGYQNILSFTPNHKLVIDLSVQQYEKLKYKKSILIIADSLSNIAASPDLRKKLWAVLQSAFL